MNEPGNIPIPPDFKYWDVLQKGRPVHQKTDPFRIRHPSMDVSKRAKIFAPFDALRGFSAAILAQSQLQLHLQEQEQEAQTPQGRKENDHVLPLLYR